MKKTTGTVISIYKLRWLRFNTKASKVMDIKTAKYPHIIKIRYNVDGKEYIKRQYIGIWDEVPEIGTTVYIALHENKLLKAHVINKNIYDKIV